LIHAIRNKCSELFNEKCKKMGIFLVRFDGNKGILRCRHIEKENAIKILNSIEKIKSKKISIQTVGTSGTIKSLNKKHLK